jgi:hypothetical protein
MQLARCDRPLQTRITRLAATKNLSPVIAKQAAGMNGVALRMLLGDRAKYMGLIFGIAFSTMLMSNQVSIFTGLMLRTASQILDAREADAAKLQSAYTARAGTVLLRRGAT